MNKDTPQQLLLGFQLDESATLENFQAAAADLQLMQYLRERVILGQEPLTFFWGKSGVGKTHLLQALCHELTCVAGTSIYLPLSHAEQIVPDMLQGLEHLDLVCLDDINGIAGQADWEQALFGFYNQARTEGGRLVITAEKPPAELAIRLPDLHSRLQSGAVYQLHELSDSEKADLLLHRARLLGVELPKSVVDYVLQRHDRRVSALVRLLQKLDKLSLEQKRPITIPLVKQLMNW
ncbi:MAG: DnaA regulatory inactivator Hda [Gammaproteobacteria bacterium]|nr:DnaA regulatory inactivator Hda [Gammaproteobacteria bacterium]